MKAVCWCLAEATTMPLPWRLLSRCCTLLCRLCSCCHVLHLTCIFQHGCLQSLIFSCVKGPVYFETVCIVKVCCFDCTVVVQQLQTAAWADLSHCCNLGCHRCVTCAKSACIFACQRCERAMLTYFAAGHLQSAWPGKLLCTVLAPWVMYLHAMRRRKNLRV